MKWLTPWGSRATARRDGRRYRSLQFSSCEPRHLLTGFAFDPIQSVNTEIRLAPTTRLQDVDVNGDGDLDLVALQDRQILVFDNNRGTFTLRDQPSRPTSAFDPERSRSLQGTITDTADLDGDGDRDLVVHVYPSHAAWIENVDGRGAFDRMHFITDSTFPMVAGDVDGDGDSDLIENGIFHQAITWYENTNGHGKFVRSHRMGITESGPLHVTDIDLDNDVDFVVESPGRLDVYENRVHAANHWSVVEVALDDPLGTLHSGQVLLWDDNPWVDFVAASATETVVVHDIGRPRGEVSNRVSVIPSESHGYTLVGMADLNGDRRADQILFRGARDLAWSPQQADGTLAPPRPIHTFRSAMVEVVARDWDGDQDLDLLVRRDENIVEWIENRDGLGDFGMQRVSEPFLELNYDGFLFGEPVSRAVHPAFRLQSLVAARMIDWSGDGLEDLVTETQIGPGTSRVALFGYVNEGGRFGPPQTLYVGQTLSTPEITRWTTADVDGDALPELAIISQGMVLLYRHRAEGEPFVRVTLDDGAVYAMELVDVDGDGDRDLFLLKDPYDWLQKRSLLWIENTDGRGTFGEPKPAITDLAQDVQWSWHNMTGDGRSQLVVTWLEDSRTFSQIWSFDEAARSFRMVLEQSRTDVFRTLIADLDGDGASDILDHLWESGDLIVSWNRGLAAPFPREPLISGFSGALQDAGDVDGDGDIDLIFTADRLAWLENQQQGRHWVHHDATDDLPRTRYQEVLLSDVDGDRDVDLITVSETDGRIVRLANRHVQWDWSQNQTLDRVDLDAICLALANHSDDLRFDVDSNGRVDAEDLIAFRHHTLDVKAGDVDDDGLFSSSDLVVLMQRGQLLSNDDRDALWSEGDFDCSGRFDTHDLVLAMAETGYSGWRSEVVKGGVKLEESERFNGDNELVNFFPYARSLQADIDADGDDDLLIREGTFLTWYRNDGPDRPLAVQWMESSRGNVPSAAADLDGDGDVDWYDSQGSSSDYWLENVDGLGHFETRHEMRFEGLSDQVAPHFADWDRDGDLDMIAVRDGDPEAQAASLVLFENADGRGAFREAMTVVPMRASFYTTFSQQPFDLADIDNDGWIDLVHHRSVWYRNLEGSLRAIEERLLELPDDITFGSFQSVRAIDLDHDGDQDLVRNDTSRRLYFAYNDGTGQFTYALFPNRATSFWVTDTDNNGRWELLVGDSTTFSWSEQAAQWTDPSRAGFETRETVNGFLTIPPAFMDRDGDGRRDLIVATNRANEPLMVLVNEAPDRISWQTAKPLMSPWKLQQIETFDVDGDGHLDLLAQFDRLPDVQWLRNLGDGAWAQPAPAPPNTLWGFSLTSLDVDQDGDMDVASRDGWWKNEPGVARADWRFKYFPEAAIAWKDMDQDGDDDLVSENRWVANERGTFSQNAANLFPLLPGEQVIAAADFNADGYVDIVAKHDTILAVYYQVANEWMDRHVLESGGNMSADVVWDIDRDGDLDIVSSARVWNENEGGRFVRSRSLTQSPRHGMITDQVLADFDGDGIDELIVAWAVANDLVEVVMPRRI